MFICEIWHKFSLFNEFALCFPESLPCLTLDAAQASTADMLLSWSTRGTIATYSCHHGYYFTDGSTVRTLTCNGTWPHLKPECAGSYASKCNDQPVCAARDYLFPGSVALCIDRYCNGPKGSCLCTLLIFENSGKGLKNNGLPEQTHTHK
jgi:Sushi repeat (SCR repeat)